MRKILLKVILFPVFIIYVLILLLQAIIEVAPTIINDIYLKITKKSSKKQGIFTIIKEDIMDLWTIEEC